MVSDLFMNLRKELNALINAFNGGNFKEAERLSLAIAKLYPDNFIAWKALGLSLKNMKRLTEAVLPLKKAMELMPSDIETMMNLGIVYTELAVYEEAENIYRRVIALKPNDYPEAYLNLGVVLKSRGKNEEAEKCCRRAIELKPDFTIALNNLGVLLRDAGKLEESEECYRKVIEIKPDYPEAYLNLGVVLKSRGKNEEAEKCCRRAIELKPDFAESYNNIAIILQDKGGYAEAEKYFRRAIELNPKYAEAYNNIGNLLKDTRRNKEAEIYYKLSIKINPKNYKVYNNLGLLCADSQRLDDAETFYRKAIELNPNYAEAYNNLGNILRDKNQMPISISKPMPMPLPMSMPASANADKESIDKTADTSAAGAEFESEAEAEKYFRRAIELNPNYAEAYNNLGNLFNDTGRIEEAKEFYLKALSIKPDFAVCHKNLAQIKTFYKGDSQLETLNHLYENLKYKDKHNKDIYNIDKGADKGNYIDYNEHNYNNDNADNNKNNQNNKNNEKNDKEYKKEDNFSDRIKNISDKIYICFALAKADEDLNEIDAAFDLYSEGNKLMKMKLNYNIAQDIKLFENIKSLFASAAKTPIFPSRAPAPAPVSASTAAPITAPIVPADSANITITASNIPPENAIMPIMIVGMPRSGTSLAEQIIASHSKVFGGGELNLMDELVKKYYFESKESCASCGAEEISRLIASDYVNEINKYGRIYKLTESGKKYFTDKMPLNFRWLGFILLSHPAVKIIHAVRNRNAVCWSVFKQLFSGTGMGFAYDLKDIYKYYGLYENIMEFWEEMFPSRIYRLDYERLTASQKEETQKLLDYCGLGWEDGCMEFEKNKRAVRTASFAQVRKKIYTGSSEEWKKFKSRIETALI